MLHIFSLHTFSDMVLSQAPPIPRRNNRDKIIKRITKPTTTTRAPSDDETSEDCPEPYGFFADADQCDKYHACSDGRIEGEWEWSRTLEMLNQQAMTNQYFICLPERLCPDGLVFNDYDIEVEKCDLPYNIDCSKRPLLRMLKPLNWSWNYRIIIFHSCTEEPKPSNHCPRQNGYFGHADKGVCGKIDGVFFCLQHTIVPLWYRCQSSMNLIIFTSFYLFTYMSLVQTNSTIVSTECSIW